MHGWFVQGETLFCICHAMQNLEGTRLFIFSKIKADISFSFHFPTSLLDVSIDTSLFTYNLMLSKVSKCNGINMAHFYFVILRIDWFNLCV